MQDKRERLRCCTVAAILSVALYAPVGFAAAANVEAAALSGSISFQIGAQSIVDALKQFASQSGIQLIYETPDITDGTRTAGLVGTFTPEKALAHLLAHTNLEYRFINSHTVSIRSAQDAPQPVSSPDTPRTKLAAADIGSEHLELQEVVITAQKRQERLIDTPQSVSVLSSDAISNLGATQFRDLAATVPGLSFTTVGAGYNQIKLRGVTLGQDSSPTVGVYLDDVPIGSSTGFAQAAQLGLDVNLLDVERIEVLRGPQGTLYGASTMGGLIKYVSKEPSLTEFAGNVETGISSTESGGINYNGSAAVNLPLQTDWAAIRLSGFYSRDGGYIDNVALGDNNANRANVYGGKANLLLKPTSSLSINVGAVIQDISRNGQSTVDYSLQGSPKYEDLNQYRLVREAFFQRFSLFDASITYDLGGATITSVSSYQDVKTTVDADDTPYFGPLFSDFDLGAFSSVGAPQELETKKYTQELRAVSKGSQWLDWLIGAFYTHESSQNIQSFDLKDLSGQTVPNDLYQYSGPTTYQEYAGFADLTFHITSKFDMSGGVRYAHNLQSFTQFGSGALIGSAPQRDSRDNVFTYLANARYHISDDATGYVRYATGYRPGGPNFIAADPTTGALLAPATFRPDHLKSYEAGIKTEFLERKYSIDLSGYYIKWDDIQILTTRGGFSAYVNASGGATIRGTELTLSARPVEGLAAAAALAYQDAHLSQADADLGGAAGERLPNVPRFTGALNADYRIGTMQLRPTVGATVRYTSNRLATFNENPTSPQYYLPAYTTVDFRCGVTLRATEAAAIDIQLFLHNAFDKRGQLSAATNLIYPGNDLPAQIAVTQPRTVGLNLMTHF